MSAAFFCYPALDYYKKTLLPVKQHLKVLPISGWLILLTICVYSTPFASLVQFIDSGIFTNEYWHAQQKLPNVTRNFSVIQLICSVEVICNTFLIVYSVVLAFLFYKKRDTFVIGMVYFLIINVVYVFVDVLVAQVIHHRIEFSSEQISAITWHFLYGAVLTPYLLKSWQVRETFVFPYKAD
jgi:hypothetical protein